MVFHKLKAQPPDRKALIIPLVLLLLLTAGSVLFYLAQTARLLDEREVGHTTSLARSALEAELNHLGEWAYDYGYWDESVSGLINSLDPVWADENIGSYLANSYGISASAVYSPQDELLISFLEGNIPEENSPLLQLREKVRPLLAETRAAAIHGPKPATGLIQLSQTIYLVAAQAIMPEHLTEKTTRPYGVLVLLKAFDLKLRDRISREYLLPQLEVQQDHLDAETISLNLAGVSGESLGFLTWQAQRPGRKIFHDLAPAIPVPLFLGLGLVLFFLHRMSRFFDERLRLYNQLETGKENLEQSEETLGSIIEVIPSPLFFKNAKGYYLGCNQAFCDYLGLTRSEIIGHRVHDIAPEDLANIYHQADLDLLNQGECQTYTAQAVDANGNHRDILFNKAPIRGINGEVIGLAGVMTDISAELDTQREMARLKNLLRNIIDSMPSLLITVDEELRVTQWNRWAALASRVSAEKALGRPLLEVFPALSEHHIDIAEALGSGDVKSWPRIPWKLLDREIFIDLTVYPLDKSKGRGAVLRADNTTDRVHMEEVMVLGEKMLSIGSLAAGMAHEINNPLAIILQHAQIIGNRLNPELQKNQKVAADIGFELDHLIAYLERRGIEEMLESIRRAGNRAKLIVEEMVNFSQRHETRFIPCDLPQLIESTLHLAGTDYDLKKKFNFNRVEIRQEIAADLPPLTCDTQDIQQALLNLLRNSAKALHDMKRPDPCILIRVESCNNEILMEVTDNGPGIEPELLTRVFEPFFTTSATGEGTGLGLSAAYFIIHEKHGGELRVENLETGGCRFIISLPLKGESIKEARQC